MFKKGSTGEQFAIDIKGFEEFYKFIINIFKENKWSLSSVQHITKRFIEGFKYDGILPEDLDYDDLKNIEFIKLEKINSIINPEITLLISMVKN